MFSTLRLLYLLIIYHNIPDKFFPGFCCSSVYRAICLGGCMETSHDLMRFYFFEVLYEVIMPHQSRIDNENFIVKIYKKGRNVV